jgi:hypothetical protein
VPLLKQKPQRPFMKRHYLLLLLCTSVTVLGSENARRQPQVNLTTPEIKGRKTSMKVDKADKESLVRVNEESYWQTKQQFPSRPVESYSAYPTFPDKFGGNWGKKKSY